eukprot:6175659-Pleurochrysis_carterae.AAC.3
MSETFKSWGAKNQAAGAATGANWRSSSNFLGTTEAAQREKQQFDAGSKEGNQARASASGGGSGPGGAWGSSRLRKIEMPKLDVRGSFSRAASEMGRAASEMGGKAATAACAASESLSESIAVWTKKEDGDRVHAISSTGSARAALTLTPAQRAARLDEMLRQPHVPVDALATLVFAEGTHCTARVSPHAIRVSAPSSSCALAVTRGGSLICSARESW